MEYQIIRRTSLEALVRAVNRAIKESWKPLGGVAVQPYMNESSELLAFFCQAMIKE